jgi:peptidoglycan hydrolase-like protein with peptidoglycan-binding domain
VREVQRRLTRLGYRTGPIDGLLGPLTRSSIQWFQIKHGLRPTGVVAASTLAFLRHPRDATGGLRRRRPSPTTAPTPQPGPQPTRTPAAPAKPAGEGTPGWLLPLLIGLGVGLLAAAVMYARSRRNARPAWAAAGPDGELPVIGYVSSESTELAESTATTIGEACQERGWTLEEVFHDWDTQVPSFQRPGLSHAFDRLRSRTAARLVVSDLHQLAGSLEELQLVLAGFREEQVMLTALDIDRHTEDFDLLVRRIRRMRGHGMTFQAIADVLNAEEVPASTEEEWWRPSTVRIVLGTARFYRRSRSN